MRVDVGIIGGTGIGNRLASLPGSAIHVPTSEGLLRGRLVEVSGKSVILIGRHGFGHKVPPHAVNYKAMALGLHAIGVGVCFATAAVGSLRADWGAGTRVVCSDFVDLTARNETVFERSVKHTDFSLPFGESSRGALIGAASARGVSIHTEGIYVCGNGPRYETPHEIEHYKHLGDVVGMTAATEAIVMREAGIDYGCLAIVTNLAAGISDHPLSHEEVVTEMERGGPVTVEVLLEAVRRL